MALHRRAAKRDAAEPEIVKTLEAHGCIVWRLSGKGLTDLVVFWKRKNPVMGGPNQKMFVADVKGPKEKATPAQEEKWGALTALGFAVFILRTPNDAVAMLNNALAPWEPAQPTKAERIATRLRALGMRATVVVDGEKKGSILAPRPHGDDRGPKAGDAAKARAEGRTRLDEQWDVPLPNGRRLRNKPRTGAKAGRPDYVEAYTPPRSKPVDAAKEAEAEAFAPADDGHKPCARDCCAKRVLGSDTCMEHDEPAPAIAGTPVFRRRKSEGYDDY